MAHEFFFTELGSPSLGQQTGPGHSSAHDGVSVFVLEVNGAHEAFTRVAGGNLGSPNYWQRLLVNRLDAEPTQDAFAGYRIDEFGGSWATPTDWHRYGKQPWTTRTYYFLNQFHYDEQWRNATGVIVEETPFQRGTLYRLSYNDMGSAYNAHIIEIAIMCGIRATLIDSEEQASRTAQVRRLAIPTSGE